MTPAGSRTAILVMGVLLALALIGAVQRLYVVVNCVPLREEARNARFAALVSNEKLAEGDEVDLLADNHMMAMQRWAAALERIQKECS